MEETDAPPDRLTALLERIREASRDGAVLRLDEACGGDLSDASEVVRHDEDAGPELPGAGKLAHGDETEAGSTSGAGVSPAALIALAEREAPGDLAVVSRGQHAYLYSPREMTRQYAEAAVRAAEGDATRLIAETVRTDSATYPRPTPIETFAERPFGLTAEQIRVTLQRLLPDPDFDDIRTVTASDGTLFLFSARHLEPAHAASLVEWLAVGRSNNP